MSRIQDILSKAERDGTVQRTRGLSDDGVLPAASRHIAPAYEPAPHEVPSAHAAPARTPAATAPLLERDTREVTVTLDERLVAALSPHSLAAEQYRSLRTRIKHAEQGRAIRAIVVTSPAKGDGKSLTAANLALTMAQEFQQRVLLIDGDLRRPSVHRLFGLSEGPGLSDVLTGAAELNQALVSLAGQHLTLLPAGAPPNHPAELLGSASMRRTLDALRTRYDRILIDMPPVAPLADVQIVEAMADGLLMIVRAGVTPKPAIERALAGLDLSKVLGLVLNEAGGSKATDEYKGYKYIAG